MPRRDVTRRQFLRTTTLGAAAIAADKAAAAPALGKGKRNAILIISDTMRRDALGCFGGSWIQTPHLNAFARALAPAGAVR
jgi:glucan phosphoethanolaminetransferase (alkaline phosphatase superfamily)